jgi:hypothetical protein
MIGKTKDFQTPANRGFNIFLSGSGCVMATGGVAVVIGDHNHPSL